ncbi:membrane protein insertion efficiency factor YidD [Candidatus Peregrinibacteria bacterium]|nr:membrane protein insertion efficiency factor YidD [Candidatus Peregrinibacteria bacterium]
MKSIFLFLWHIPRNLAIGLVRLYQKTLSPDHSFWARWVYPHGHCKFRPTCSEYAKLTYQKNGFIIGTLKTSWRLLRCHPWAKGGIDFP